MNLAPDTPATARQPGDSRRRCLFAILAIACGLLPLLLLELGLRWTNIGKEEAYLDPLVGFSRVSPLFELDEEAGVYRTSRSRQVLFETQEFSAQKPADEFRVFCLGGSTVRGRPYTTQTAFPRWLQLELNARDPDRHYEIVNCGGLSYASYRLTHILHEVLEYDPDLIIIATGHNEFLEDRTYGDIKNRSAARSWLEDRIHRLKTIQLIRRLLRFERTPAAAEGPTVLPDEVEARLDQGSGYASYHRDDDWSEQVLIHFDQSLRSMVTMCQSAGVPVVLVQLGSNVRDCPPFKSEHRPGLSTEDERAWQADIEEAVSLEESDPQQALAAYKQACVHDDEYALLPFRMGQLLDRLGRREEATAHYLAAKELDVCPLRMREDFAATLQEVADQTGTPLVDARGLIESQCESGPAGNDWYMDHVHPRIGAHQLIAAAIATELSRMPEPITLSSWPDSERRLAFRRHMQSLGPMYLTNGYERVSWLENWARRQRLLDDTLPRDPAAHLRYGHRLWDFGDQERAWEHYQAALDSANDAPSLLLGRARRLFGEGRGPEALQLLSRLAASPQAPASSELEQLKSEIAGAD